MKKNILVTGGAGFIGSNLIETLIKLDYFCISIDNYSTGSTDNNISSDNIKYIEGNICDRDISYLKHGISYDCIIHCAAKARIQQSFLEDKEYFNTNIIGTYNVVKFAVLNNIPLIYLGTSSHHAGRFSNPYTFTKDIGEDIIELYQKQHGLLASIARLYNVYGPKELTNNSGTLIGKWKYNYWYNLPFIIYGDGSKKRDFTHVNDVTNGIIKILQYNKYGYIFELGRGKYYSIKEIASMFEYDNILYKENLPGEAQETMADNIKTKEILNWTPIENIEDYIEDIKMNRDFKYDPIR